MATIDYIYREFVCSAAFSIMLVPRELNTLQVCACEVLSCSPELREQDFPESLRHEWRTIEDFRQKLSIAQARSRNNYCEIPLLTTTDAQKVLDAFATISEGIARLTEQAA